MSTVAVDIIPSAPTSLQVTSNSTASVDVGPAIVQSVAIEDINGQYAVELAMVSLGPQGPEGKPGRVIDILGTFGISRSPSDLPPDGFIPANWDSPGKPAKSIQFTVGDALTYIPSDTAQLAYGHNFAFTGGAYADAWLDCGVIKGDKGDTGSVGPVGAKGDTGSVGPANSLAIGNVVTGASASASITGLSPNQTLNLVLPKGDTGADGHSPAVNMNGDQITVDGVIVGPHLTGPQGPQGEVGKSLTILGYYATEALLRAAHPTGALGDCYLVGDGYLYVWGTSGWANVGQLQGPKGDTGATGSAGPANSLSIGAVTSGTTPSVTIRGASPNQILDFVLQKGDTGATGSIGPKGDTGSAGPANTLSIGSVTSSDTASATITGASPNQTLNLVLPKGDIGPQGPQGPAGSDALVTYGAITSALGYTPANTSSPAFTGTPTAPTALKGDNSTALATTAFVMANQAAGGVSTFNNRTGAVTLISSDVTSAIGFTPANTASPALSGIPTAPTAAATTNNTQIATTAYVKSQITGSNAASGYVKLSNGLIFQWGTMNNNGSASIGNISGTYPTTFPTAVLCYSATPVGGNAANTTVVINITNSSVTTSSIAGTLYGVTTTGGSWAPIANFPGRFFVIGY